MNEKELYVVIETGGSIGEISNLGNERVVSGRAFKNKEDAVSLRKHMTKSYAGGYYDYHYSVKTLEYAKKYCKKTCEDIEII